MWAAKLAAGVAALRRKPRGGQPPFFVQLFQKLTFSIFLLSVEDEIENYGFLDAFALFGLEL